jgi:hypothetical protein
VKIAPLLIDEHFTEETRAKELADITNPAKSWRICHIAA